jgi:nucleotide-binding universal stress UspA family protein
VYSKILVPLDGSKRAERILPHVEMLALQSKARLVLLQVVLPKIVTDGYNAILPEESMRENRRRFDESLVYLNAVAGELREKGIHAIVVTETGPVVTTIIRVAGREQIDLIAMASHGRSGISQAFYGSVAAGVLNQVDRPLLIVRSRKTN